jgi:hypothetical protein
MIRRITLLFLMCTGLFFNAKALLTTLPNGKQVYEIPVAVHVMYTGAGNNVSDATIVNWLNYVNQALQATYTAYPNETNGGVRIPVILTLAKRGRNCNALSATGAIDHILITNATSSTYVSNGLQYTSGFPGLAQANWSLITNLSEWPHTEYLNIWIVNKIDGQDGSSFPNQGAFGVTPVAGAPVNGYGVYVMASQVAVGNPEVLRGLGMALGGFKEVYSGTPCASASSCATNGDLICDTEPVSPPTAGTCPVTNACTGLPYTANTQHNFMNRTSCRDRYTVEQRNRISTNLNNANYDITGFITSVGAMSLPIPVISAPACTTTAAFPSNTADAGPREIVIVNGSGTTYFHYYSGGYNGDGNNAYVDNTCKHLITLYVDSTYTIGVKASGGENVKTFIDYNNDGIFQSSEKVLDGTDNPYANGNFTIPSSAVHCTPIRMRVVSDISANSIDSCGALLVGQAEDYAVQIKSKDSTGNPTLTISNPPAGGNPSCYNTGLNFTSTYTNGVTPVLYQWYKRDSAGVLTVGPTTSNWNSTIFLNKDTVWLKMYYSGYCSIDSVFSNRVIVQRVLSVTPAVTIGMTKGINPSCIDDTVIISVTGNVNPGGNPTYQWKLNGVNYGSPVTSGTFPSLDVSGIASGSVISVSMTSSAGAPCNPGGAVISNNVTVTHAQKLPTLNIALTSGTNPGCAGQVLTFKATGTITGTSPSYQWLINGLTVSGATSTIFSSVFNNNDIVSCRMTSSSPCATVATVTSNTIQVIHQKLTANITISQVLGTNPICSGHFAGYSATITNAGANPQYQWMVNGKLINNANGPLYASDSFQNNDQVACILIATDPCIANPLDTSNILTLVVHQSLVPNIGVNITSGKNPGCLDSVVQFTATATNLGSNPNYIWFVNGIPVFTGDIFSTSSLLNGDIVIVQANQTDGLCYLPDTILSIPDTMVRNLTPKAPLIHLIGNQLITFDTGSFIWFGPNGKQYTGGRNGTFAPDTIGYYYAVRDTNGCWSKPSNILQITLLDVTSINMDDLKIYPNPTTGLITLDWGTKPVTMDVEVVNPLGQHVLHDELHGQSHKELDLKALPNGVYYLVVKDEQGKMGTVKLTLNK